MAKFLPKLNRICPFKTLKVINLILEHHFIPGLKKGREIGLCVTDHGRVIFDRKALYELLGVVRLLQII